MTLIDVIGSLALQDTEAVIYAHEPWTPDSVAVVGHSPGGAAVYFLDVITAIEVLDEWVPLHGAGASLLQRCERLIHYAINDA